MMCVLGGAHIIPRIESENQVAYINGEGIDWDDHWWEQDPPPLMIAKYRDDVFSEDGLFAFKDKPKKYSQVVEDYNKTGPEF